MGGPDVDPVQPSEGETTKERLGAATGDEASVAEIEDRWRRAAADLENYRRRFERELDRGRVVERETVLEAWLGVIDGLERALEFARGDGVGIASGLEAVVDQAHRVLERFGYERIDQAGVAFDPGRHEVVAVIAADPDHPAGTVVEVTRPGWGNKDRVLRPASVVVARAGD